MRILNPRQIHTYRFSFSISNSQTLNSTDLGASVDFIEDVHDKFLNSTADSFVNGEKIGNFLLISL